MKTIALIPARGGSKRVPRKNIKLLANKPLIAYTIQECLKTEKIDKIIVSTDDDEIAKISKEFGATVIKRPKKLASDKVGDREVMLHCIEEMKKQNYNFDAIFYARPTTPFKQKEKIEEAIEKLENNNFTAIRSITKVEGVYHPYWMYKVENNILKTFIDNLDVTKYYQSQLLPDCYRLNGVVDIVKVDTVLKNANIYGDRIGFIETDELHSVDIDTEYEFMLCEFLLEKGLI